MQIVQEAPRVRRAVQADVTIGSITYRSRATGRPGWAELDALTRSAQARNHAAGLTGMLLYEDGRFYQWIEGPPDQLEPVWDSIRNDRRHRDVDVLSTTVGRHRMFAGWDMRWVRKGERPDREDALAPGLAFLEPVAPSERYATLAAGDDADAVGAAIDHAHPRLQLAELLDHAIEPTARALGDAWLRDDIDELSLTVALGRLNRLVHDRAARRHPSAPVDRSLLAATMPGEPHLLGAVAAADLHVNAGWRVALHFPATVDALLARAREERYDRIDVATSDALDRGGRVRAEGLAGQLKRACRNPAVEISFGGRAFWEEGAPGDPACCTYRATAAAFNL